MTAVNTYQQSKYKQCPDVESSNTTLCRIIHAITAISNPPQSLVIHCPHTQVPSPVCIDKCDSVCETCNQNADCIFNVDPYGIKTYNCTCKEGYIGDGFDSCTAINCTAQYQCGEGDYYNYANCNTSSNLCYCLPTFTWNPITQRCECQGQATVQYINSSAVCLPIGRCTEKYQCTTAGSNSDGVQQIVIGNWNQLQCVNEGFTAQIPFSSCVCNYGYNGGYFIPCVCPSENTEVYSSIIQGNLCLSSNECGADYNCPWPQTCNFSGGPSYGVGYCVSG